MGYPGIAPNGIQATGLHEMAQSQPSFLMPVFHDFQLSTHLLPRIFRGASVPRSFLTLWQRVVALKLTPGGNLVNSLASQTGLHDPD